jgi:peptide/nickel transport system substrate-binding protein
MASDISASIRITDASGLPARRAKAAGVSAGKGFTGTPYEGGSLVIGTTQEPDTLNPDITQLVTATGPLSGIMEGLIDHDSHQRVIYRLATSYSLSKNNLTYTWHLRHGVRFQNGAAFTARDVVANYHVIMNPRFGSYSTDGWKEITRIAAPNPYTVVMTTKKPFAPFVVDVGGTPLAPAGEINRGVKYFQQTFGRHPIGTGPYTFVRWVAGQEIDLKKNPNYWGGKPHIDTITFKIIPNDNTEMVQLRTGEIQMTDSVGPTRYPLISKLPAVVPVVVPSLSWYHLDLKNIGLLRDVRVRKALAYATPVQEIIDRLLGGFAAACPTDTPPGTSTFDPHVKLYPYDLKTATSLLQQAGLRKRSDGVWAKGGQRLSIEYWIPSGDQVTLNIMEVVANSWRQLGVDVSTHTQDINSIFGANGYQFSRKLTAGGYSWFNNDDPDDRFYWNSINIPKSPTGTGGDVPEYFYKYPWQAEIDRLTNQGVYTVNPAKRKAIYWKIQELLHEQEPLIFMDSLKLIYAAPRHMSGFDPSAYDYGQLWNAQSWHLTK